MRGRLELCLRSFVHAPVSVEGRWAWPGVPGMARVERTVARCFEIGTGKACLRWKRQVLTLTRLTSGQYRANVRECEGPGRSTPWSVSKVPLQEVEMRVRSTAQAARGRFATLTVSCGQSETDSTEPGPDTFVDAFDDVGGSVIGRPHDALRPQTFRALRHIPSLSAVQSFGAGRSRRGAGQELLSRCHGLRVGCANTGQIRLCWSGICSVWMWVSSLHQTSEPEPEKHAKQSSTNLEGTGAGWPAVGCA